MGVLELDWKALKRFLPSSASPKFSALGSAGADVTADNDASQDVRRLLTTLSADELSAAFIDMLKKLVGEILRTAPAKIDEHRSLYDMGLDSLMGVELSTAIEARFSARLPVMALSENPTIARLSAQIISQLNGTNGANGNAAQVEKVDQARHIATQHADEAHADVILQAATKLQSGESAATSRMIQ